MSRQQIRSNQLITTYGPGAMIDLPDHSVIVAGLDNWRYKPSNLCIVEEPRLAVKVANILSRLMPNFKQKSIELRKPPPAEEYIKDGTIPPGVAAYIFPHWFLVQNVELTPTKFRRRRLVDRGQLTAQSRYRDADNRTYPVVPVRFVRACRKGHVGDIQWRDFAHNGPTLCQQDLWLEERGSTGDLSDTWIACDCGANRKMSDATEKGSLGRCNGSRPWMDDIAGPCGEDNRLLIRTASNAYFPQILSVISIPDSMTKVEAAVLELWDSMLCNITDLTMLGQFKTKIPAIKEKLGAFDDADIMRVMDDVRNGKQTNALTRPVKTIEFEAICKADGGKPTDTPDGDFFARRLDKALWSDNRLNGIGDIFQVHRLREVVALLGFTRFEPVTADSSGELNIQVEPAAIVRQPKWIPASENRGEGIFIQFQPQAIEAWLSKPAVIKRDEELRSSYIQWQQAHPEAQKLPMPGLPYLMLHSLSHMLISAISLECGYPLSALRERIYAPDASGALKDQYGILILTASSDAEGTLGGLVQSARDIRKHLIRALRQGMLCSNDPVCSGRGSGGAGVDKVSGSACHGCLYIAETSCERFNQFLDRSLVVSTIDRRGCEFFSIE